MKKLGCIIEELEEERKCSRALAKCKKQEDRKLKNGYKWITVDKRTKVLAECGNGGRLTAKGQRQVESVKRALI
ncbi:hypothetical protein [Prevotella sp. E2-28]|uniref:hypothetical protein n=1 Tax=Prevotella sp. E2-28 TaxID=2913620 RepID=UPI001ED9D5D5|nr:hypothetical protein [Prevotella sp. E2-28]UKK52687.1 hypothetical protein L6465_08725 [Prevotella sp. E2-28]